MTILAVSFLAAFLASLALTPWVTRLAVERGAFDTPARRRADDRLVPRLGGVAVFVAVLLALLASGGIAFLQGIQFTIEQQQFFLGILIGGGILFGTGLVDDLVGLPAGPKLIVQCVGALAFYNYGFRLDIITLGTGNSLDVGAFALPLTILWILAVTNAFNLIDGMDGLASGLGLIALLSIAAAAAFLQNGEAMLVALALGGALLGFIRHNLSPARVFLGDGGSLFIGGIVGALALQGMTGGDADLLVAAPLLALALPLLDTSLAIVRRWLRSVPIFSADKRHIHHRIVDVGVKPARAAALLTLLAAVPAAVGLGVAFADPESFVAVVTGGAAVLSLLLLWGLWRLGYHEFTEAVEVLRWAPRRLRTLIRDRIHARDVAAVITTATSVDELNAILHDNADAFGFLEMEICLETSPRTFATSHRSSSPWKLDWVVDAEGGLDPLVLRIWCDPGLGARLMGAERVAGILAPTLTSALTRMETSVPVGRAQGRVGPPGLVIIGKSDRQAAAE